jgi:transposase
LAGHRQASVTARRYGISTALLFTWRKAYRAGTLASRQPDGFMPLVIGPAPAESGRLEIVTPSGYRVIVEAGVDETALVRVLAILARS